MDEQESVGSQKPIEEIFGEISGANDHQCMTYAAVKALPREDQEYLEPERELLITRYCEFPDLTANCYGEWGGASGYPDAPRWPDSRREWDLSYYLGWDTLLKKRTWEGGKEEGGMYLHGLPDAYPATGLYFGKAVESFRAGRHADAVRFLGVLAHYVEDPVTFSEAQVIHRRGGANTGIDHRRINIDGYQPQLLATSLAEGAAKAVERLRQAVGFAGRVSLQARRCIRDNDRDGFREMIRESDQEGARAFADMVHTAIFLGGPKQRQETTRTGENLVFNGDFELEEDFSSPAGWFVDWHDLGDHVGVACHEGRILRCGDNAHGGAHSVKIMWSPAEGMEWLQRWRSSVPVVPGERYRFGVWVKTRLATGDNYLAVHFHERDNRLVETCRSTSMNGDNGWTLVTLEACAPPKAEKMRIGLFSAGNKGAVWFDDVTATRLAGRDGQAERTTGAVESQRGEDCVLSLRFDRKPSCNISCVVDDSVHGTEHTGANFPIASFSGGGITDLHFEDKKRGMVAKFDGKDDFVEIAYCRPNDVLNPTSEFTVAFWMFAAAPQESYLVAKEGCRGETYEGYRFELGMDGNLKWIVSFDHASSPTTAARYPVGEWVHVAGSVDGKGIQRLFVNGAPVAEARRQGTPSGATANDFYLGADTGVDKFFDGMLDEVKIFKRALPQAEIEALMRAR